MKELCLRYDELHYNVVKTIFDEAERITLDEIVKSVVTEVTVMALANYNDWSYSNDKKFLKEKNIYNEVKKFIEEISSKHFKLVADFISTRGEGLTAVEDVKEEIKKILNTHKLPGKCKLI